MQKDRSSETPQPTRRDERIAAGSWGEVAVPFAPEQWKEDGRLMCRCPRCGEVVEYAAYSRHYVVTHELGEPDDDGSAGRPLLAAPIGRDPDWSAAAQQVEAMTTAELDDFAEQASAILGKRHTLTARNVREVLRTAVAEVRTAWSRAQLPNEQDDRERHVMGEFDVLTEPHPLGRRTILYCSVELLHRADLLDALSVRRYVVVAKRREPPCGWMVDFLLDGQPIGWAVHMRDHGWVTFAYVSTDPGWAYVGKFDAPELGIESVARIGYTPPELRREGVA